VGHYIAFVHGNWEQPSRCYKEFNKCLKQAYEKEVQKTGALRPTDLNFVWEEVHWADVTQPEKQEMRDKAGVTSTMRRFAIGSIGDVIAYTKLSYPDNKYEVIQKRFKDTLAKLGQRAFENGDTEASLTVIAHSLGTVISSDGIYDMCNSKSLPGITVDRFISMGSPIALYGLRYGLDKFMKPIRPKMWINFWYSQDLIAFPLKSLNEAYSEAVTEDVCLSTIGGSNPINGLVRVLVSRLPQGGVSCNSWYFSDKRVIKKIAEALVQS
jgi:hypothetical protein